MVGLASRLRLNSLSTSDARRAGERRPVEHLQDGLAERDCARRRPRGSRERSKRASRGAEAW